MSVVGMGFQAIADYGGGGVFHAAEDSQNAAKLSLRRTESRTKECGKNPTPNLKV